MQLDQATQAVLEAERSVLGSVLRDPRCTAQVLGLLGAEDFVAPRHRSLFSLFGEMEAHSMASADAVTVASELARRGQLDEAGGREYLRELMESVPSLAYLENQVDAVFQNARRRRLADAAKLALESVQAGEATDVVADRLESEVMGVRARRATGGGVLSSREALEQHRKEMEQRAKADAPTGMVPTRITQLDELLGGGFFPGELVVVAGRPGMGKSMFADGVADVAGEIGPTLYVTIEMTLQQQMQRAVKRASEQPVPDARRCWGQMATSYLQSTSHMAPKLAASQVFYLFEKKISVAEIRGQAMNLRRERGGMKALLIDYLQLIDTPNSRGNRQQDIAEITRTLKILAGELSCPLILLAQLNRETGKRENKRPLLTDLRESGAIEQDANRVLLLHRPGYYDEKAKNDADEVIVAKDRDGEGGTAFARFDPARGRWTNSAPLQVGMF